MRGTHESSVVRIWLDLRGSNALAQTPSHATDVTVGNCLLIAPREYRGRELRLAEIYLFRHTSFRYIIASGEQSVKCPGSSLTIRNLTAAPSRAIIISNRYISKLV